MHRAARLVIFDYSVANIYPWGYLKNSLFYAIMVTVKKPSRAGACGSWEVGWIYGFGVLTTPLTIYGFGLRGRSVLRSLGKHRFPIRKHWKSPESAYFTGLLRFGYWRPRVRVPPLRPKKSKSFDLDFFFEKLCFMRLFYVFMGEISVSIKIISFLSAEFQGT